MSKYQDTHVNNVLRSEPWLGAMAGSLVSGVLAAYAPPVFVAPLAAVAAVLFTVGLLMLQRRTLRRARARRGKREES